MKRRAVRNTLASLRARSLNNKTTVIRKMRLIHPLRTVAMNPSGYSCSNFMPSSLHGMKAAVSAHKKPGTAVPLMNADLQTTAVPKKDPTNKAIATAITIRLLRTVYVSFLHDPSRRADSATSSRRSHPARSDAAQGASLLPCRSSQIQSPRPPVSQRTWFLIRQTLVLFPGSCPVKPTGHLRA
jgi:hypothetical protein